MNKFRQIMIGIALFTAACTPQWTMKTESSSTQFLWPVLPEQPRIKYVMSIKGFEENNSSLKTFILGRDSHILARPVATVTGIDGRVAIADTESRCVHLYIPAEKRYIEITMAGQELLQSPVGIAFDEV